MDKSPRQLRIDSSFVSMPYFGILLRPAEPDDAIAVARVHVRSWQAAYRSLLPDAYLDQLRPEDRAQTYDFAILDPLKAKTIVAAEAGMIQGFATTAPSRDPDLPGHGEVCALYIDPGTVGPWYWRRPRVSRSCQPSPTRISKRASVGPGGQRSCGTFLSE
jgi:hypothetical protein